jgi:integrase/recombinase XerD
MWEQFVQERVYLKGISPATIRYYKNVHSAFQTILPDPTQTSLMACIKELRERGVKPVSINTWLRGLKAYLLWRKEQGDEVFKIQFLKCEQKLIETLSTDTVARIINFRPKGKNLTRAWLIALTILDTGLRASEVLGLTNEDVDLNNLILKVKGKGGHHRLVPFNVELRKAIYQFTTKGGKSVQSITKVKNTPIFGTKNNTKVSVRNLNRDFKVLGKQLGITGVRFSPHTLRHTFAASWIRRGGDLFLLSKVLGHTNISTTQKYLQSLGIEAMKEAHARVSLLSR